MAPPGAGVVATPSLFLSSYPRHYVARRLEAVTVDGRGDEWEEIAWSTSDVVDITAHGNASLDGVDESQQMRFKVGFDASNVYVLAELKSFFVYAANGPSHNVVAPYKDDDFELFVDPTGSTQGYVEFEVSSRNATYDVLWGVPDLDGLSCDGAPFLPPCVNTSFPGYAGTWTTFPGLRVATAVDSYATYGPTTWTVEAAFPFEATASHGGLLDGASFSLLQGGTDDDDYSSRYHPAKAEQVYWFFDVSRAVHPRRFDKGGDYVYCPLDCDDEDLADFSPQLSPPTTDQCQEVLETWPTLLGVDPYSCYWEYVFQDLGPEAYMHRPLRWAVLQFQGQDEGTECKLVEWPGRYLASQIFYAQRAALQATGHYASSLEDLLPFCLQGDALLRQQLRRGVGEKGRRRRRPPPPLQRRRRPPPPHSKAAEQCDAAALRLAHASQYVFRSVRIDVTPNATTLSAACTARPCFTAYITAVAPESQYEYSVAIDENSRLRVHHSLPGGERPCLI